MFKITITNLDDGSFFESEFRTQDELVHNTTFMLQVIESLGWEEFIKKLSAAGERVKKYRNLQEP